MTCDEAVKYIHSLDKFGSRPGLDRIELLLKKLGDPQDKLKFIHVAGTNGKGSTCTFLSSILREAGFKCGLYISPYVVCFNERMQINGEFIGDGELAKYVEKVKSAADSLGEDFVITEFEFITAAAFCWFCDSGCDIVVLEVGLGGRLDATNVIKDPLVSVIMRIDLDHTAILGDTVEAIAAEKAGIIKPGCPVVMTGDNLPEAVETVRKIAAEKNSAFSVSDTDGAVITECGVFGNRFFFDGYEYSTRLSGKHQVSNAVTAITAVRTAFKEICRKTVAAGLYNAVFPARCEVISREPLVILDGSHNPNGTAALDELLTESGIDGAAAIVGMMADKDVKEAIGKVVHHFSDMITVTVKSNPRTMTAEALKTVCGEYCRSVSSADDYEEAILLAKSKNKPIVVFGSLYLSGDIRELLIKHFSPEKY